MVVGGAGDGDLAGVDRDGRGHLGSDGADHGRGAADFLFDSDFRRAGAGGFAADVEDVGA